MSKAKLAGIIATVAVVITTLVVGTAYAVSFLRVGGATSRQYIIDQTNAWTVPSVNTWTNVPSASVTVTIPAGTRRLISARFNAESLCTGPGWCSVRVIYVRASNGATAELGPQSGTDFAFDSAGGSWEAHAIERTSTTFLPAGTYSVRVQAQRVGSSSFRLDDYLTNVSLINP
jgi:hypothetical protein